MSAEQDVLAAILAKHGIKSEVMIASVTASVLEHYRLARPGEHHGTYARWQREYKAGGAESTCDKCRAAKREYARNYRAKKREEGK